MVHIHHPQPRFDLLQQDPEVKPVLFVVRLQQLTVKQACRTDVAAARQRRSWCALMLRARKRVSLQELLGVLSQLSEADALGFVALAAYLGARPALALPLWVPLARRCKRSCTRQLQSVDDAAH
eukprot:4259438-Prymnesium_polylepis.1